MEFFQRAETRPSRLGILPGTFNPVTVAHMELARVALEAVDEVLFVLPRVLPHKEYSGVSFGQRMELLMAAARGCRRYSLAAVEQGLFIDIAAECRGAYGDGTRLTFLCGRDAAERIANWDYGRPGVFREMLGKFDLLVAARQGEYRPHADFAGAIAALPVCRDFDAVSASQVRERIVRGEPWEHMVPPAVRDRVREVYGSLAAIAEGAPDSPPGT